MKSRTVDAETLWAQAKEIIRRYKGRFSGTRVSFYQALKVLTQQGEDEGNYDVTAEQLMQEVEGMPLHQAKRIFGYVSKWISEEEKEVVDLDRVMERVSEVE